jgi:hypothetical protein
MVVSFVLHGGEAAGAFHGGSRFDGDRVENSSPRQLVTAPPFTWMVWPVIHDASVDAR